MLTSEFSEVLKENFLQNFHLILLKVMQKMMITEVTYVRNLGFSIFVSLIFTTNHNIFYDLDESINFKKKTSRSNGKRFELSTDKSFHDYLSKKLAYDYTNSVELILENYSLDQIIDSIYSTFDSQQIGVLLTKQEQSDIEKSNKIQNAFNKIDSERIKLRSNIIASRVDGALCYNDLENVKPHL
jgi:hypothetical protein